MYSLNNIYTYNDLLAWNNIINKNIQNEIQYICEPKYDGVSIDLIYINGSLKKAITRGDGIVGDDVTNNIKTINSIPLKLSTNKHLYIEARGEIILPINSLKKINIIRKINKQKLYSNLRNAVSGILRCKNINEVKKYPLKCFIYSIDIDKYKFNYHTEYLEYGYKCGFKISKILNKSYDIREIFDFIQKWNSVEKYNLLYQTDGVVIKINSKYQQKYLGHTSKYPRWAIAFKFKSKYAKTKILKIDFQIGKTGKITPVAILNPILLDGTIIKKVSLYNETFLKKLQIYYNDTVFIEKGGGVIPKITNIDIHKRIKNPIKIVFINKCPYCRHKLVKKLNEHNYYCNNKLNCLYQKIKKLEHFCSKKSMNINGLGINMIKKFFENNIIKNISDLYHIKYEDLVKLNSISDKYAKNILYEIEKSKKIKFEKVLYALSIPKVGEITAKKLVNHFNNVNSIMKYALSNNYIKNNINIHKVLKSYFSNKENIEIIENLKKSGLIFNKNYNKNCNNQLIYKKKFLFTGKLSYIKRDKAEKIIEDNGGQISNKVNLKLNFLIVGKNPGTKLKKSLTIKNIEIINEDEFMNMINHL